MFKISRAYLANTGYRMAWYDGLLLDFRDPESMTPTSTIYNLVNQGGKTTFLSLLFSCVRTKKDEFLQTLANPGQRFEDYFDQGGTPGLIAIEWCGVGADSVARSIVTGQVVVLSRQDGEAERWFFLVSDTAMLALESLPGPNLSGDALTDRAAVVQWLHQTRSALGEQAFFYTQVQSEWAKALASTGLDVELVGRQVDFNKREGAMDESFLSFKDEREFLLRFLTLTMNAENADRVYQAISVHSKNIASRKPLEAALGQLERLQGHLRPFSDVAAAVGASQMAQDEAEAALSSAVVTLTARSQSATLRQQDAEAQGKEQAAVVVAKEAARVAAAQSREVAVEEQLKRLLDDFEAKVDGAATEIESLRIREKEVAAARTLHLQVNQKLQLSALTAALDALNGDIVPLRAAHARSAAQFSYALRTHRQGIVALKQKASARADSLRKDIVSNKESQRLVRKQLELANGTCEKAGALLETGLQQRLRLEGDGTIQAGETSEQCVERWARVRAQAVAARDVTEAAQQASDAQLVELNGRDSRLSGETAKVEVALTRARARLKETQAARAKLCVHPVLCQAIEANDVDPDSEVLPGLLARHQQDVQRKLTEAELTVGRLDEDARSLEDTGLAGRNLDVTQVVRFLAESGIKGVRAYAEYISEVVPDAAAARALVQSDPARFLGVVVPGVEQLERASKLQGYPPLSRPVVISVAATAPARATQASELFVVESRDASLFNLAAASELGSSVEAERLVHVGIRDEARRALEATLDAKGLLNNYLAQHGPEKVAGLQDEISRAETALEQFKAERLDLAAEKASQKTRSAVLQQELKEHLAASSKANEQVRKVQDFVSTHESRAAALADERAQALAHRAELSSRLETLSQAAERDEAALRIAVHEMDAREAEAKRIGTVMGAITGKDDDWRPDDTEPVLDIERSREAYSAATLALKAKETGEAAGLQERKDACEKALAKLQEEYVARAAGLARANIEALWDADLDAVDREITQARPEAQTLKDKLVGGRAVARNNRERWREQREYVTHHEPTFAELSASDLTLRVEELDRSISAAVAAKGSAQASQREAEIAAKGHQRDAQKFREAGTTLRSYEAGDALARDDMFLSAASAVAEATTLRETAEKAEKHLRTLRGQAAKLFEAMQALAADTAFAQIDLDLALMLRRNTLTEALDDHERLGSAITQRMDCIKADLSSMDADFGRAMDSLLQLVEESLSLLKRATQGIKLPEDVPRVAGRSVIKILQRVFEPTREARLEILKPLVLTLAAENRLPGSGPALATHALMHLANDKLGLKLLKVVDDEQEQYVAVERMSKSGAESVSMAMLLYFVIAKLRSEEKSGRHANAGVLILDNPFSKATSRPVWEIIVGLADKMGLQLILATGIKEYETLSVFKRFIRVAKVSRNSVSGRTHLGFADFTIKPVPAPALAKSVEPDVEEVE